MSFGNFLIGKYGILENVIEEGYVIFFFEYFIIWYLFGVWIFNIYENVDFCNFLGYA